MTDTDNAHKGAFELTGSIWFTTGSQNWGSQRRMALLQAIDDTGSISAGARKIGLSYKAAWDAVDIMNTLAAEVLVERSTGGQRGGGARLTKKAKDIVALYQTLNKTHDRFLNQLADLAHTGGPDLDLIRNLMVIAPARNKLTGQISKLQEHTRNHDVTIDLGAGDAIVASVSPYRRHKLALRIGKRVIAFVDATAILIGLPGTSAGLSARNSLTGKIQDIVPVSDGIEVSIGLKSGLALVSKVTPMGLEHLGLKEGQPAQAIFKASSVLVGLPADETLTLD